MEPKPRLAPEVITLGLASLFTDMASEMIYPLLPVFLATVLSAGAVPLGIVEGVAESSSAIFKMVSGFWADRVVRRKPFVLWGYTIAGLARPFIGLARSWPFVLLMRFTDRCGKGMRTSPRDALIADVTDPKYRGFAYGYHRAMDHAGAVLGPLLAAVLLKGAGFSLRTTFLCSMIPSLVVIALLVFGLKEKKRTAPLATGPLFAGSWDRLGSRFHWFIAALIVFTLGNSSDAFLLLRLSKAGVPAYEVALLWSAHHVVKLVSTYFSGKRSDTMSRKGLILVGWIFYAAVYATFGWATSRNALIGIFLAYGLYFGLTEPVEKALISDLAPQELRGSAFGYYNGAIGLAALPASLVFGWIWYRWSALAAFGMGTALACAASVMLVFV